MYCSFGAFTISLSGAHDQSGAGLPFEYWQFKPLTSVVDWQAIRHAATKEIVSVRFIRSALFAVIGDIVALIRVASKIVRLN